MISAYADFLLTHLSASVSKRKVDHALPTRRVDTPVGSVRVYDSGSAMAAVIMVPDGPNVIEHYAGLIKLLSPQMRVVCFDMPGFGHSLPKPSYGHKLDQGAQAVLGVMDSLGIDNATLAFSCANGFYALRAATLAPQRITHLLLSQTPSLEAMHAWAQHTIPSLFSVPVLGQLLAWLFRKKVASRWYRKALPRSTDPRLFGDMGIEALSNGGCFCLASVVQALVHEKAEVLTDVRVPCTVIWGMQDASHLRTDPSSLVEWVPHANVVEFADCGHFPDIEHPSRFAEILLGMGGASIT